MKKCIAVLTRGYEDITQYYKLLNRNKQIEINLDDKSIDILIFHEGNITPEQQIHISSHTPILNIKYIDITSNAFLKEKSLIKIDKDARCFGLAYRYMCSFWFVDFLKFVSEYDFLLRIDEDCFIDCNIDNILLQLNTYYFVAGSESGDKEFVTKGLNNFTLDFIKNNKNNYEFKSNTSKPPSGPYTNLIGINLNEIRKNETYLNYVKNIDLSNMIYERRWGDLPLWGEVIHYIFEKNTLLIDNNIKYYHESHRRQVN